MVRHHIPGSQIRNTIVINTTTIMAVQTEVVLAGEYLPGTCPKS